MDLETFKILYERFSKIPLEKQVWNSTEYEDYINTLNDSKECSDFYFKQEMEKKHFDYSKYCCLTIAHHISEGIDKNGEVDYDNVDVIIREWENGTIGIPIHDSGTSMIEINYCPFCGKKLTHHLENETYDR